MSPDVKDGAAGFIVAERQNGDRPPARRCAEKRERDVPRIQRYKAFNAAHKCAIVNNFHIVKYMRSGAFYLQNHNNSEILGANIIIENPIPGAIIMETERSNTKKRRNGTN